MLRRTIGPVRRSSVLIFASLISGAATPAGREADCVAVRPPYIFLNFRRQRVDDAARARLFAGLAPFGGEMAQC
jgi:hypothetical protein